MKAGLNAYKQVGSEGQAESADAHKLIQMLMDGCLDKLGKSAIYIQNKDYEQKGKTIGDAISIISALRDCLDHEKGGSIAQNLYDLYTYMIEQAIKASSESNPELVKEVMNLMLEIKAGWDGIRQEYLNQEQGS